MHRIDTSTAQKDKFGQGKNGFTRGNPQTGTPATQLDYSFFDAVQEEITGVIESAGLALNKKQHNQLVTAIQKIIDDKQINIVKKSGDTMTGNLTINNSDSSAVLLRNKKNEEWMLRIHADGSFSIVNKKDGKWVSKFRNDSNANVWRFENTADVTISGKSALKEGDGGLLSYTQTIRDVFSPDLKTGFYRFDANSINTPYKGLGYFNKISWNANESVVIAYMYNSNRVFTGYKDKSTGEVKYSELLKLGDYGIGAPTGPTAQNLDEHLNSGFYGTNTSKIPDLPFPGGGSAASLLVLPSESTHWKVEQLSVVDGRIPRIYHRTDTKNDGKQTWYESITTANVGDYTHQFLGDLANKSLNDLTGTDAGNYFQGRNTSATAENGYPITQAGTLTVMKNGADGAGCCQIYTTYRSARQFIRNYRGGTQSWEPWVEVITTANEKLSNVIDKFTSGGIESRVYSNNKRFYLLARDDGWVGMYNTVSNRLVWGFNDVGMLCEGNVPVERIPNLDQFVRDRSTPVGIPQPWPTQTPPKGWVKCNGWPFDKNKYPRLAAAYPSGFLPDMRGEFIRGWDDGRGVDPGRQILSWQPCDIQRHNHTQNIRLCGEQGRGNPWGSGSDDRFENDYTFITGDAGGMETRPRSIAFLYIVKAE